MIRKIENKINLYFEKNFKVFPYSIERCRCFFLAQTPKEALPNLWHISQLVYLLPDELVIDIIKLGWSSQDPKIREEIRYLIQRWDKAKGKKLLSLLENNAISEIVIPEGEGSVERYLSEILHREQEKDYKRFSHFVMGFGLGGGLLLILGVVCLTVGIICGLPYEITLVISYIPSVFGIEGILVALFFLLKREVIIKRWQQR